MSQSCIFCRIARRELPAELMHEDDQCVAFRDLNPQAPVHWLIVPKRHIERLHDLTEADRALLGHLLLTARAMAERAGVAQGGYRTVINNGADGGQTVPHLHLHLFGGRAMRWPPG
jgi:histidine triad (HIT) family protein